MPESDRLVFVQENAVNNVSQDFRLLSREGAAFADTGKRLAYSAGGKVMVHDTGHLDDNTLPT